MTQEVFSPRASNITSNKKDQIVLRPGSEVEEVATLKGKKSVMCFLLSTDDQSSPSLENLYQASDNSYITETGEGGATPS